MAMTEEERFRFDLAGFLVRPAILRPDEVAAIVDQADRIQHNPESLPPEHRAIPGGAASLLIDHPKVIEVLHEIIGPRCPTGGVWIDLAIEGGRRTVNYTAVDRDRQTLSSAIVSRMVEFTQGWYELFLN